MNEKMTLEEFFALADRVAGALNVLREARGEVPARDPKLWAPASVTTSPFMKSGDVMVMRADDFRPPVTNKGAVQWTPEELAAKAALRARQAATQPTDPVMDALEDGE